LVGSGLPYAPDIVCNDATEELLLQLTADQPPPRSEPVLAAPHVHRINLTSAAGPSQPGSLHVFRQGYEFFETAPVAPGFRVGLNFVGFQDSPDRTHRPVGCPYGQAACIRYRPCDASPYLLAEVFG
jgi:hypothetical protein